MLTKQRYTMRLIGINTPETVDPRKPVECFGREASAEAKRLLTGQRVRIELDPSQNTYDRYGRLLGYVFVRDVERGALEDMHFNLYMIKMDLHMNIPTMIRMHIRKNLNKLNKRHEKIAEAYGDPKVVMWIDVIYLW